MSWLAADRPLDTLGDALALRPDLLAGYRALDASLARDGALPADVLARCRARVATLVGVGGFAPSPDPDDVAIEFVEQFVLDPHGVTDALVERLRARLSPAAIVTLAQAVAVWEGACRLARALDVAPEL
jgi:alkylhydroperoxidase family enzyme